jgi:thiamine biosynthesis protein ThiI
MFERVCLVHYHEIGLKGRNRSTFEHRLRANIDFALLGDGLQPAELLASRLAVTVPDPGDARALASRIARIPGVASVSVAYRISREPRQMERAAALVLRESGAFDSFRVEARRSNTDYPEPSMEMNVRIGAYLQSEVGGRVDLGDPDVTVSVIVTQGETFVSGLRVAGIGGLPVGSSGKVVSLLSAGIDSPVATWRMMRRGAVVVAVHFSGAPATNDLSVRLVGRIASVLERAGGLGRVYVVDFGELQREIALAAPPDLRILLYRRLMLKIAEKIAAFEGARALVTGESLGQVASQTLENIAAVDEVASLPVFRPLIGSDKLEIIADAQALGTYDISTEPHSDCCTLFMPRSPQTHARLGDVLRVWAQLDVERMADDAVASMTCTDYRCHGYRPPRASVGERPTAGADSVAGR